MSETRVMVAGSTVRAEIRIETGAGMQTCHADTRPRSKKDPMHAATFVCRGSVNIGMALSKSRRAMTELEGAL